MNVYENQLYVNVYEIFRNLSKRPKFSFINVYLHQQVNVYDRLVNDLTKRRTLIPLTLTRTPNPNPYPYNLAGAELDLNYPSPGRDTPSRQQQA